MTTNPTICISPKFPSLCWHNVYLGPRNAACIRTHPFTFPRFLQVASQEAAVCFAFMTELKGEKFSLAKVAQRIKGAVNWLETTEMQGWRVITTFVSADAPSLLCHTLAA